MGLRYLWHNLKQEVKTLSTLRYVTASQTWHTVQRVHVI